MKQTVLITGAASGMGLSYTKVFGKNGFDMVLVDINGEALEELRPKLEQKYGCTVMNIVADLSKDEAAKEIFDATEAAGVKVDVLVNNAGFGDFGRYIDIPYAKECAMMGVNCISLMYLTHLYGNDMAKRGGGRILNIASIASYLPGPYMPMYYATKAFVYSFSEAVYYELKSANVHVTCYTPGPAKTSFEKNAKMDGSKMFTFKPLQGGTADETAERAYNAVMSGKHHDQFFKHKVFEVLCRIGPEALRLPLCTYINIGKFKAD